MVRSAVLTAAAVTMLACGVSTGTSGEDGRGLASSALDEQRRAWFAPNVGTRDTLRLFEQPETWAQARGRLGVFQLYAQNLASMEPAQCPTCNDVLLPGLERVDAFRKLKQWNVALAFEMGSVKHHTCEGAKAADFGAYVVGLVEARGGEVSFIAMDEPYAGGNMQVGAENCRYSRDQSADQVARFVERMREKAPGVRVGDIEPYPYFKMSELMTWVDALRARGVDLAFFHVDIDRNHAKKIKADVYGDLGRMRTFLAERGIPMGVIFNGHELEAPSRTDAQYYDAVLGHARETQAKLGSIDHAIVQSWFQVNGESTLPANLPFEGKGHTRLFFEIAGLFGLGGGGSAGGTVDEAAIKVKRAYLGVLGREADAGGLAGWADALRRGQTSAWLCGQLAASAEFRSSRGALSPDELAQELYRGILGREGDPDGLATTAADLRAGRLGVRAGAMLDSPEFRERFLQP